MLPRDVIKQTSGDELRKNAVCTSCAYQTGTENHVGDMRSFDQLLCVTSRINFLNNVIVGGPEKGKRRHERPRTRARDDGEFRPTSRRGPAIENTCPERSIRAAAGKSQKDKVSSGFEFARYRRNACWCGVSERSDVREA